MKRVLLVHADMDPYAAGGAAVPAWTIEALRDAYRISVLTWGTVSVELLNQHYGTSLRRTDLTVHQVPAAVRRWFARRQLLLLRYSYLMRLCRRLAADYDVVIGTNDEMDFGRRGIQYIHYPHFHDPRVNRVVTRPIEPFYLRWYHSPLLLRGYFRLCLAGAGFSMQRMRTNLTLVNSNWTGQLMREVHGIETTTVYPPVSVDFPRIPWEHREDGFVCVGRLAPEKRIETIIELLSAVRDQGAAVHLHIVGAPGPADYVEHIRRLQAAHEWVSLELDRPPAAVRQLLASHRYGIHAMRREPFGIAVAELLQAGCLLFVPDDGGVAEIVGRNPSLTYDTAADAVAKIVDTVRNPARQRALLHALETQKPLFSPHRFVEEMRAVVADFSG
jgi:glycosyltransferase involved in cell wall biosynthesis